MKGTEMLKCICWFTILLLTESILLGQIITYSFTGSAGNESAFAVDMPAEHGLAGEMQRGVGIQPSKAAGSFSAKAWSTVGLEQNDYFSFSLAPSPGYEMTLEELSLDERRSGTGIRDWSLRSSLDSFINDLAVFSVPDNTMTRSDQAVELLPALFSGLSDAIEFRIYGYHAEGPLGTWRIDNVDLRGAITPVPEVSAHVWVAACLLGFFVWRVRTRHYGLDCQKNFLVAPDKSQANERGRKGKDKTPYC